MHRRKYYVFTNELLVKKKRNNDARASDNHRVSRIRASTFSSDTRYQRMRFARIHVRSVKLPGNMLPRIGVRVHVCDGNNSDPEVARMREAISRAYLEGW